MKIHSYIFSLLACLVIALPGYSQVDRNETLIRSALHGHFLTIPRCFLSYVVLKVFQVFYHHQDDK